MCQDRAVAAPADTPQLAASRPHSRRIRALTAFDLRKLAGQRVSSWSGLGIWLAAARPARARNADQNADQSARPPRRRGRPGLPRLHLRDLPRRRAHLHPAVPIREGPVAPNWPTGIALGIGGIAGGYLGARMQSRLPDTLIRRTVGILAIAIAAQFLRSGLS
jgi:hypothetical protein